MLLNMNLPSPTFAFKYTGEFADNRINGSGTVRLLTSGTLTILTCTTAVAAYLLGGGGGSVCLTGNPTQLGTPYFFYGCGGGGGGKMLVPLKLEQREYDIVVGKGGEGISEVNILTTLRGGDGGATSAFGYTCTGGLGGETSNTDAEVRPTLGGSPNGEPPQNFLGGQPNGGTTGSIIKPETSSVKVYAESGKDGYVDIIIP